MKIGILDDYVGVVQRLKSFEWLAAHDVTIWRDAVKDVSVLASRLADTEALILLRERTVVSKALVEQLPNLRLVTLSGPEGAPVGQHIDVEACTRQGVLVCAGAQRPTSVTAELAFALILASRRHLPREIEHLKRGGWQHTVGFGLRGSTLGVYGYGKIGSQVAAYGDAFGMRVLIWSREGGVARAKARGYETALSHEAVFKESDVLSVHLRFNSSTRGIITRAQLDMMKPTALIVNVSRAQVFAPGALVDALQNGRPGYAAVDVFESEPVVGANDPLLHMENVICTPHLGYMEIERMEGYYADQFKRVLAYAAGAPIDVVNPGALNRAR